MLRYVLKISNHNFISMTSCQNTFKKKILIFWKTWLFFPFAVCCTYIQLYPRISAKLSLFLTIGCINISLLLKKSVKLAPFFTIDCVNICLILWKSAEFTHFSQLIFWNVWFLIKLLHKYVPIMQMNYFFFPADF